MSWRGRFFDGRSAVRREVEIAIVPSALHVRPADGGTLVWPFDRLRWADGPSDSGEARLALDDDPARLDVDDAAFVEALRTAWPDIDRAAEKKEGHGRVALIAVAATAGIAGLIYAAAAILPAAVAPLIPESANRAIGEAAIRQIVDLFGAVGDGDKEICDGAEGRAALDGLMQRLAAGGDYSVTVANIDMVNALAAPGGRLLVFRGLIDFAETAEEFTGVLAHEIGHAVHRHPTQAVIREVGLGASLDLLTGSAGGQGLAGAAAGMLTRTAYSRDAEKEADDTAVGLLQGAGISTSGMISLFERLSAKGADMPPQFQLFSTHPRTEDRAARIRAAGGTDAGPAMSTADWHAIKAMCGTG